MGNTFANHLEIVHTNDFYITALQALSDMAAAQRLDTSTVVHSEQTSRITQVLGYAAGFTSEVNISLSVGAILHDIGKEHCLDLVTNGRLLTESELQVVEQHPPDSKKFITKLFGNNNDQFIPYFSSELAGVHHMLHRNDALNYPRDAPSPRWPILRNAGALLMIADKTEALTGSGRAYREARSERDGLVIRTGIEGIRDAAEYACSQVIALDTVYNMDASRVTELLIEQAEFLEAAPLAA